MQKTKAWMVASIASAGCVTTEGPELDSQQQAAAVMWTNVVGATAAGNSLVKTAGAGWGNAGAVSAASNSGDTFVQFTTAENNLGKSAGLSVGDTNQDHTDIDFSIHTSGNGNVYVYEGGALQGNFGPYAANDVFRVESVERKVQYLRNGTVFYTSQRVPAYPLLVDTALFHTGSTINAADTGDFSFRNIIGVNINAGVISKPGTAPDQWGDAGVFTTRGIKAGDGYIEFSTNENNRGKTVGLSNVDASQHHNSVKWGIHLSGNTSVQVFELGVLKGTFGNYVANDVFRVEVLNNQVRYLKNGAVMYTSLVAPVYPMFGDAAIFNRNGTIKNVIVNDLFWTNAVGAESFGSRLVGTAASGWGTAGAASTATIAADAGYVEFTTGEANKAKACGLSNGSANQHYNEIDFAIVLGISGQVQVHENGVLRGTFGTYVANDTFRVQVNAGGAVEYLRNGGVFYTSAVAPTYPLLADAAIFSTGATLDNVTVVDN